MLQTESILSCNRNYADKIETVKQKKKLILIIVRSLMVN